MKKQLIALYFLLIVFICAGILSVMLFFTDIESTIETEDEYITLRDLTNINIEPAKVMVKTETPETNIYIPEIDVDNDSLLDVNPDYMGWIYIPETEISLPVVMGNDNSYYLNHTFYNYYNELGCLYYDTASTFGSQNRVIYGHNFGINSDLMFSHLINYQDQIFADDHKYIYIVELNGEISAYQIYAVVNFDTGYINECDYRQANFKTEEEYMYFIDYLTTRSCYTTDFIPTGEELLTLQTCNRQYGSSNRLLICCAKLN